MYNQLADMAVIQDRVFMIQILCLMLEKSVEDVISMLKDSIDLG